MQAVWWGIVAVRWLARQLQGQERLTQQVAMELTLEPAGLVVRLVRQRQEARVAPEAMFLEKAVRFMQEV